MPVNGTQKLFVKAEYSNVQYSRSLLGSPGLNNAFGGGEVSYFITLQHNLF